MEHSFLPRSLWTSESKFLQHATDLYTSVVVTRDIPAGTSFGPCVLQNTFYDTIAFIALKSCDKINKSYLFRVDPEAMQSSSLVLSWLRLVQAARSREEQNTEAYLKAGQLYVRTTRDIRHEEELLVWYDHELSHLLGFTEMAATEPAAEFRCIKCTQAFKHEYPFLAHCRFLCTQVKNDALSREAYEHKHMEIKRQHRVLDFHNIARDLEHKKSNTPNQEEADISPRKRKQEETVYPRGRKSVLLEKTNISNDSNITQLNRDYHLTAPESSASGLKLRTDKCQLKIDELKTDHLECKNGTLGALEVGVAKRAFMHEKERTADDYRQTGLEQGRPDSLHSNSSSRRSAFSFVLSGDQEQKSAFCKPSKRLPPTDPTPDRATVTALTARSSRLTDMAHAFTSKSVLGYNSMLSSNVLNGELPGPQTLPLPVSGNAFPYAPDHWSRNIGAQLQTTCSLTVLPPTFTSFGVSVQNWCAKCNLSFRMTSDLVFHMRSHHKKEFAPESQVRRRREEKLICPICNEFFRERHHLSRHMTSHN
ncbi:PR domain zinc finger protein 8 [Hypomesus transpacificus]|uniref:PR domain zinc finger protein 8 n=1 Tax=Hypomesus transpacificus TaxID=137520 RepID=UPI001F07D31E|nr:PR domain zinc finger protein 8 [Hypomesus transpacificus]XP_046886042.1 PR domain zinc finger protein 8 [Hypomesus transpacificus]